jgi:plastocyanin
VIGVTGRRVALAFATAALLLVVMPSSAALPVAHVYIQFAAYGPEQLDVLPGQRVLWTNVSVRTHTVTSDDRLFDSGDVTSDSHFSFQFNTPGSYRYHCTIHAGIVGEVDVRSVILDGLPTAAVPKGTAVEFDGRTATPGQPVLVQQRGESGSFRTVGRVKAAANGNWKTRIDALTTADFRAVSGPSASETRRLLVSERKVHVQPTSSGLAVSVTPAAPYAPFLVEVYRRERFGWWPVARGETNYVSEADVRVRRPARVRIVLVDRDGWTPLATSRVVRLPKR